METRLLFIYLIFACETIGNPAGPHSDSSENEASTNSNHEDLCVLALNTWGIPGTPDLSKRMEAIGGHLAKGQYDLVLLTEVWIKTHHDTIRSSLPHGYNITSFEQLNGQMCLGAYTDQYFGLSGCAGLAVVSRLPMSNVTFIPYTSTGHPMNMFHDGELFAQKGIGSITLTLTNGLTVQVLVTHMASEAWNNDIRNNQVQEFLGQVNDSSASIVIGGGDFNLWPVSEAYDELTGSMVNAFQEMHPRSWNLTGFSTFGHQDNTFINQVDDELLDYIFYFTEGDSDGMVKTKTCWLPMLEWVKNESTTMSVSDHQGIACTFELKVKETHDESVGDFVSLSTIDHNGL